MTIRALFHARRVHFLTACATPLAAFALIWSCQAAAQPASTITALHQEFAHPPDSSRIMMRWWWFGPAATKDEITREMEQMKAAGIGGVEIANLYPLALDDPATGFHNTPYLSDEHLDALRWANQEGQRLGIRVDITLCSGWPFGGPHIAVTQAAGKLRVEQVAVPAGATAVQEPFIDQGEGLISAFIAPGGDAPRPFAREGTKTEPVDSPVDGWYKLAASPEPRTLLVFVSSRTGMMVKRPSVGAAGFVLDHYDHAAIDVHLHAVGDRLMTAFGDHPPYAVFSDSLEDYASDWSPAMLDEFQKRRGYDLRPHLPALVMNAGAETAAVRHDWGRTLTELADENFLTPIEKWAGQNHTRLRSQTYGFPPVTLWSNRIADLIEGEGKSTFMMWREFSDTRWAASAAHLFHRQIASSETWTWLDSPAFRATPLDMKAEADLHFLQGVNQLVGHGWPYSPPAAGEPGWRMYAAAAFDAHNPWYAAMPDLAAYLQRVSFALRQGQPANDVALLLPNDDVWSNFFVGLQKRASPTSAAGFDESGSNVTIDETLEKTFSKKVIAQILDAGFNLDFIDADTIDHAGIPYKILVLPAVNRLPVATYEKILDFAHKGGVVIATKRMPATAPGLQHAEEDSARLKELSKQLFDGGVATAKFLEDEAELGDALKKLAKPDMTLTPPTPQIGFIHRKLDGGDLYFVANTANVPKRASAQFRDTARRAEIWDAFTGEVSGLADAHAIDLDLAPYESQLIYFSDEAQAAPQHAPRRETALADLSEGWKVSFGRDGPTEEMSRLVSWTDDAQTKFFSGRAVYEKRFEITRGGLGRGAQVLLDFGRGTGLPVPDPPGEHSMKAYLDAPVRDAAEVFVNGQRAGVVWHPPYRIDVTSLVRDGANELRIGVGNTAINELAGQSLPNYRLLWDRYGMLFVPQDMHDLHPLPSGLLGPVTLVSSIPVK